MVEEAENPRSSERDRGETLIVIRPSFKNLRFGRPERAALFGLVPTVLLGASMYARSATGSSSFWLIVGFVLAGVVALGLLAFGVAEWLVHRNMRLFADGATFGMTNLWGKTIALPVDALRCVQLGSKARTFNRGRTVAEAWTSFVLADGSIAFKVVGREVSQIDLQRICDKMGVPLSGSWDIDSSVEP